VTSWNHFQQRATVVLSYYGTARRHGNEKSIWRSAHCIVPPLGKLGAVSCDRLLSVLFLIYVLQCYVHSCHDGTARPLIAH
jgi:hypothetical protein